MQQDKKSVVLNRRFAAFENMDGHILDLIRMEHGEMAKHTLKCGGKIHVVCFAGAHGH